MYAELLILSMSHWRSSQVSNHCAHYLVSFQIGNVEEKVSIDEIYIFTSTHRAKSAANWLMSAVTRINAAEEKLTKVTSFDRISVSFTVFRIQKIGKSGFVRSIGQWITIDAPLGIDMLVSVLFL